MSPLRVLLDVSAVPERPVGAGVYTIALARELGRRDDVALELVARRGDADRWRALAPAAGVHAVAPRRRPTRLAWEQLAAPALVRRLRPDVWHGPHYTLPVRAAVPAVVTVHDLTFFDHPEWHERTKVPYFRRMIRLAAARAAVIVCVSEHTATRLRAVCDVRGDVRVVPHGVDHERFAAASGAALQARDLAALARHAIRPPYVAFAGTIEPRKDLPALVAAFARVAADRPRLRLVIGGRDGWGARPLRDAVASSGVATRIVRPGYLDDETLAALFRRAEVVAYPTLEEGFGLPALEALACGTPLVSTRGSAVEEVVGDAALLVPPGDAASLAAALARILDDADLAARLRRAGPAHAASFTWPRSAAGHVDAYRRAAQVRVPA